MKKKQLRSRKNKRKVKVFRGGALPSNITNDYHFTIEYTNKVVRFDKANTAFFETDPRPAKRLDTVFSIREINDTENTFVLREVSKEEAKRSRNAMFSKVGNPIKLSVKYVPASDKPVLHGASEDWVFSDESDNAVVHSFFYILETNQVINLLEYSPVEATVPIKTEKPAEKKGVFSYLRELYKPTIDKGFAEAEDDLSRRSAQPQRGRQVGVLNYGRTEEWADIVKARGAELQTCIDEKNRLTSRYEEIAVRLEEKKGTIS